MGVLGILVSGIPASAQEPGFCPENRADNPSFEFGFSARERTGELVANAWNPWFEALPGVGGINFAPEFAPRRQESQPLAVALHGLWSQELSTEQGTHVGGVWQRVEVPTDSQVYARAFAYGWASSGDDIGVSEPPGQYALSIGIDPLGGSDPAVPRITWTNPVTLTDVWVPLELDVPVEGPQITLFLKGQGLKPLAHNVSRWDAVCLRVQGPAGVPTEPPTWTPQPTATLAPGAPTYTPDRAALEATATAFAQELAEPESTATRFIARVTLEPPAPTPFATQVPPEPGAAARLTTAVRENVGLLFLAVAGFLAGVVVAVLRK